MSLPGRRSLLKGAVGCGFGLALTSSVARAQDDPASLRPQEGDLLVKLGDASVRPLGPGDVLPGATQIMVWAMSPVDKIVRNGSRLNRLILVRLDPEKLAPETLARAADGVVAYTAVCTHTGCEVTDWLAADQLLYCPCHFSKFDPRDGARVVDGPAPRTLPALPLKVVDGQLVVAGSFTARVGFEAA